MGENTEVADVGQRIVLGVHPSLLHGRHELADVERDRLEAEGSALSVEAAIDLALAD